MFAFCTIFNYTVSVCVTAREYVCVCQKDELCPFLVICVLQAVLRTRRPLSITQNLLISFLVVHLFAPSNPQSFASYFSGKASNPNLNWGCPLFTGIAIQHK